jgi:hypothetical protein
MPMSAGKAGALGALGGFFVPNMLGFGGGGAAATPAGGTLSILPWVLVAGGAFFVYQNYTFAKK